MAHGKLLCVLGLATSLLAGYVTVCGVVGPVYGRALAMSRAVGGEGRTADECVVGLGVREGLASGPVLGRGRAVFGGYAARVRREGGF
jgi:hypothetical protein